MKEPPPGFSSARARNNWKAPRLRIKEVTVEVLHSPATASQQLLLAILTELKEIRALLPKPDQPPTP
jgi:hypothetical protein